MLARDLEGSHDATLCWSCGGGGAVERAVARVRFRAADLDDGTGQGQRDNVVDVEDFVYFLIQFESGTLGADVDAGAGDGTPDGAVTIDDLVFFLQRFEAGC